MQDCRMRRFEGRQERNKHVEDKQARPQDNFWAQFKGKILRTWSQCLTQLLCDLLFHHPGHSLEYMRVSVNRCLQACMCVLLQSRVVCRELCISTSATAKATDCSFASSYDV